MRIGIDLRCLLEGRKTGVGEYALNFLRSVLEQDRENEYFIFLNSFRGKRIIPDDILAFDNVHVKDFRIPNKIMNLLLWYFRWPKIDKLLGGVDILFLPNINFSAWSKSTKTLVTFHDLSFDLYPETFSWKRRLWHFLVNPKSLASRADGIIAVSESTRDDLMDRYKIPSGKIKVIHSGITEDFRPLDRNNLEMTEVMRRYNLPYKFILYLGTIEPRKNIIGIVQAYDFLRRSDDPELAKYKLVIAGATGWKSGKIENQISDSSYREDIISAGKIEEGDMPAFYNLATVFVYPSLFEGFGFPPLEAMSCGTPVIISNTSSLPEIAGEAALMVDPDKPDEIAAAIKEIVSNRDLKEGLCKKGLECSRQFSWKKSADRFLEMVNKLK